MTFLSALAPCEHLPGRSARRRYVFNPRLRPDEFAVQLEQGWRRFGPFVFRQECPTCRMCRSIRVPAATFRPSSSQRRAWKRNERDVTLRIGPPVQSQDRVDLLARFHHHGHVTRGWPADAGDQLDVFVANPYPTEEWTYWMAGRLVGVGYVDALETGLSAIYFYWDPDERSRALGTFNIMALLGAAGTRRLPYVYLGYFVDGCRSLEYKSRFRPNEVLNDDGEWVPFVS